MLQDQISKDYVQAMKARDSFKSSTLNFLRAKFKDVVIEKRIDKIDDVDAIAVIKKQVKQRQESIELYTKGGRKDLADKEEAELELLKNYLPQELPEEEVEKFVQEAVKEVEATSMKDMGKVMKAVGIKVNGCADNRMVSALVKKTLMEL